ncbi:DUF4062 domain-containing protein [Desulfoluna spongiiphila]|uniref:DUF4062 domain-containing protein n=1 Tax=Desulfoluna spongiiphila TaxID=419481 RepID=A0A1G5G662_9BACT|nr:DUF4062 domain-containing protein [Desulfoluna spongiiphila]SCY46228.1 protein of unknown function [Desulfoluna spongiiphila]
MEKKHQVFVSSTYRDLIEERKEVIHALLELDCIPAGMELFPATDEDAWSLITEVIDGCDYYILIVAGKYGSTNSEGFGYTEMEFDYAVSQKKPIITFLNENIDDLPSSKVETSDKGKESLKKFRDKAKGRHCKFWSSAPDLGGKVSRSLIQLRKKHPSDGWVPGRYAVDQKMIAEMERMRARIAELEIELLIGNSGPPSDIEDLICGDEVYSIHQELYMNSEKEKKKYVLNVTWDKLFSYCGPVLSGECTDSQLQEKMSLAYWHAVASDIREFNDHLNIIIPYVCEDQIKVQFQALGLMEPGTKKRAVSDTNTYWNLTSYGERYLIKIKALRRNSNKSLVGTATATQ